MIGRETVAWSERRLPISGGELAWYDAGSGDMLVFLHGGPGLDHRTVRALAEPLTADYRCVLYDQRASGESRVAPLDGETLHIDRHIEDLDALRMELDQERLTIIGWSWGAMLALLYGAVHPERVQRIAAISTGPLTPEFIDVYRANSLRPLDASERQLHADLKAECDAALARGDVYGYKDAYFALTRLSVRAWFYDPHVAQRFLLDYLEWINDPFRMATVQREALASLEEFQHWDQIGAWSAPTLVLYGYQDFEPITQAFMLREWIPDVSVEMINECGHWPWLEQPEAFYRILRGWLAASSGEEAWGAG